MIGVLPLNLTKLGLLSTGNDVQKLDFPRFYIFRLEIFIALTLASVVHCEALFARGHGITTRISSRLYFVK
jgi:hypothetical protein